MIVFINVLCGAIALTFFGFMLASDTKEEFYLGLWTTIISLSIMLFFSSANFITDPTKEIHERKEIKEVLTTQKVLTIDNEVEEIKESDIKMLYKIQQNLEKKNSTFYIVKYKEVGKEMFDNSLFNRKISKEWEVLSIEDLD